MNADQLLAHYEKIAEAPEAIPRLRRFVLDLAVRGKLVPQDPSDEPASELLERIMAEKTRLVEAGKIKATKQTQYSSTSYQFPYDIPTGWQWVPFGSIVNDHLGGGTPSKNNLDYWDGDIFWASVKDVGKSKYLDETIDSITHAGLANSSSNLIPAGNFLVVTRMGLGKVSINRVPVAINQDLRALFLSSLIDIDYAYIFFQTYSFEGTGLTVKGVKLGELLSLAFPLPPLAEQRHIVARVDELMTLCDRLERARETREACRDRLAAASLARLNRPDPDEQTFRDHAAFVLDNLTAITTRPDQIKQIRQTILSLAVQGKLVPQNPNDEPASELLRRISEETAQLVREKKIRKKAPIAPITPEESQFTIPTGWAWSRLGDMFQLVTDGAHHTPQYTDKGVPFLSVKDVSSGVISFADARHISPEQHIELCKRCCPEKGDILLTKVGTTGIAVPIKTDRPFSIFVSLALLKFSQQHLSQDYLCHLINSPFVKQQSAENTQGIGNQNLVLRLINAFALPAPPLPEQHRIVAKIDELMELCDRLEASLDASAATRRRLLDALLHATLSPETREREAA